jgi:uncharacterized protein YkwD
MADDCDLRLADRAPGVAAYVEQAVPCLSAPPAGFAFDATLEADFLALINAERRDAGLAPVAPRAELRAAARFQSLDMAVNGFFGHEGPDGRSSVDRIAALDRTALYDFTAENIATVSRSSGRMGAGFALKRLHANLMDSPGHRANILHPKATHVALGVARTRSGVWVTQLFMHVSGTLPEAAPLRVARTGRMPDPQGLKGWKFVRYDFVLPSGDPIPDGLIPARGSDARLAAYATQPGDDGLSFYWIRFLGPAVTVTR